MNMCRGCLVQEADAFLSLFSRVGNISVEEMFLSLTGLTVSREDGLPRYICQECCQVLIEFYKFRERILWSDEFLRSSIEPAETSFEQPQSQTDTMQKGSISEGSKESLAAQVVDAEVHTAAERLYIITESMKIEQIGEGEWTSVSVNSSQTEDANNAKEDEENIEYLIECSDDEQNAGGTDTALNVESRLVCCACPNLVFISREELDQHSVDVHMKDRIVNNLRPYECTVCFTRFSTYTWLKRHQTKPYRERKYACKQCDLRFFGRSALLSHVRSKHTCVRTYVCDVCQKAFFTSSTLLSHQKIHTDKQHKCQTCMKLFLRRQDLLSHQMTHLDERPYSCDQCEKRFKSRSHLRNHRYVHSGERRFTCDFCDARFTTYMDRRVHLLKHENIDPYKCGYCEKVFKRNFKLQVHIRRIHTNERPYGCDKCEQKFFQNSELTAHRRKEHRMTETQDATFTAKTVQDVEYLDDV